MSRKIYKNNVARQRAYRDRLAAKKQAAHMTEMHRLGGHIMRNGASAQVKGCPLCTVTPIQTPVTVGASA
jgi:hypothetical protein